MKSFKQKVMDIKCLVTESTYLTAQRIRIEQKQIVVRCFPLRYCFDYFLAHNSAHDRAYRTYLSVKITSVGKTEQRRQHKILFYRTVLKTTLNFFK